MPIRIATGHANTCVLRVGGAVSCWGSGQTDDDTARVQPPHAIAGLPPAREIALGEDACIITNDGDVVCGFLHGAPRRIENVSAASALFMSPIEACAVHGDGAVSCWGLPSRSERARGQEFGPATALNGLGAAWQVVSTVSGPCIVSDDRRRLQCSSRFGAKGTVRRHARIDAIAADLTEVCVATGEEILCTTRPPRRVERLGAIVQLAMSETSLCGRTAEGEVFCFRQPPRERGTARATEAEATFSIVDVPRSAGVSIGPSHACSLSVSGEVHCWGSSRLVSGKETSYVGPTLLRLRDFDELALDGAQTCALVDGRVQCADVRLAGCGRGTFIERKASVWATAGREAWSHAHVVGSYYGSCVASQRTRPAPRASDGLERRDFLTCLESSESFESVMRLPDGTFAGAADIVLDTELGCILERDGSVACFALPPLEARAKLPNRSAPVLSTEIAPLKLVPIAPLPKATRLLSSRGTFCIVTGTGDVHCWDGMRSPASGLRSGVTAFVKTVDSSCEIDRRGEVACRYGGGGSEHVDGIRNARALVAGEEHFCALDGVGKVYCWGSDEGGVLRAVRAQGDWRVAMPIALPGEARELISGPSQVCARLTRGPWMCWGENHSGSLGVGVPTCTETPVRVELDRPR
jgi:hypothetical protein